jgi:hypothetical protein
MKRAYNISSIIYNLKYDSTILRLYNLILERDDDEIVINQISDFEFKIVLGSESILTNILDYVDKDDWDSEVYLDDAQFYNMMFDIVNRLLNDVDWIIRDLRSDVIMNEDY